jgi:polygalacturonase
MKNYVLLLLITFLNFFSISVNSAVGWKMMREIRKKIVIPVFREKDYFITDYEAIGDGMTDALPSVLKAINLCSTEGGGRVVVPAGKFILNGPIVLKSNVNLYISAGAELIFSPEEKYYLPPVLTRWEGTEVFNYSPLIYGYNVNNIAITGKGILNGQGSKNIAKWKPGQKNDQAALRKMGTDLVPVYKRVFGEGHVLRPAFIEPVSCSNILIEGIKIVDATFWVIHPVYCENITVRGVIVESFNDNNDGCDPESCSNVLIEKCLFQTGDDAIAIKSGRDNDAWRIGQPSENIIIRNCIFISKINGLCIGSEISGGVKNVFIEDITIKSATDAIYFKSNPDRGGYISNIFIRNIKIDSARSSVIKFEPDYKHESKNNFSTLFKNFRIKNIKAENSSVSGIEIAGFANLPVQDILIKNFVLHKTPEPLKISNVKNVKFKNVVINGKKITQD